ncbi:hypothetical protein CERZMDRAFT_101208 [Cercospora zeae-maydis SCOH1-5]|uniref:Uncharacterized protein n=1 Tax=Cercospora zeae-maydis SCOH1-5 TaxID=717836 RepID=A0A6A6F4C0_9PEZI|nr:hypothetical protein CERZMDRAFT_101208 [Cercospora zeae-maydis SCOH1-5]
MPYPVAYLPATTTVPEDKMEAYKNSKTFPESQTSPPKAVNHMSNTNINESKNSSWSFSPRKTLRKKSKVSRELNKSFNQGEHSKNEAPYISLAKRVEIRCLLSCAKADYDSPSEDYYAWVPRLRAISLKKKAEDQEQKVRRMKGFYQLRTEDIPNVVSPRKWTIRRVDVTDDEGEEERTESSQEEREEGMIENDEQEELGDDEDPAAAAAAGDTQETFWDVSESLASRERERRPRRNAFDASAPENRSLLFGHEGGDVREFADDDDDDDDDPFFSKTRLLQKTDSNTNIPRKRPSFCLATNCGGKIRFSHPRPLTPVEEGDETATESDEYGSCRTSEYDESPEICTAERQEMRVVRLSIGAKAELERLRGERDEDGVPEKEKADETVEEEQDEDEWRVGSIWEQIGRRRVNGGRLWVSPPESGT